MTIRATKAGFTAKAQRGRAATKIGKAEFTTKVTKRTKFGNINILTLRGLRVLRGEMVFTHYSAT